MMLERLGDIGHLGYEGEGLGEISKRPGASEMVSVHLPAGQSDRQGGPLVVGEGSSVSHG